MQILAQLSISMQMLQEIYDNDEALKLKLFNAISVEEQFYE